MLFNSFTYILFLWAVFVAFWTLRERRVARYLLLLAASYVFYAQARWSWVLLLAASTLVDFVAGARIFAQRRDDRRAANAWLACSLAFNLGLLSVFKYFDFFSTSVEDGLRLLGVDAHTWRLDLVLPVGISFYTFQTLSYTIDIHRRRMAPTRSLVEFALYVSFFPQLVAGPIVRAVDFLPQLDAPVPPERTRVAEGVFLVLQGLVKKVLVADLLGARMVDPLFADGDRLAHLGAPGVLLLGMGFMLQVYGDFGGYSDIAIGSAKLLGFHLRPNFAMPLAAATLDDFWRRWHISMTMWFRDYVYVPLGGNRRGPLRNGLNVMITMVAVGLWHGATMNYVAFGLVHGGALIGVHLFRRRHTLPRTRLVFGACWLANMAFLSATILFYRSPDLHVWWGLMSRLGDWTRIGFGVPWQVALVALVSFVAHLVPQDLCDDVMRRWARAPAWLRAATIVLVGLALVGLRPSGTVPFYYFQF